MLSKFFKNIENSLKLTGNPKKDVQVLKHRLAIIIFKLEKIPTREKYNTCLSCDNFCYTNQDCNNKDDCGPDNNYRKYSPFS